MQAEVMTHDLSAEGGQRLESFARENAHYYRRAFASRGLRLNGAALLIGPCWAAARGVWSLFWLGLLADAVAAIALLRGLLVAEGGAGLLALGAALLLAGRGLLGCAANPVYQGHYKRWRITGRGPIGCSAGRGLLGLGLYAFAGGLTVYRFAAAEVPALLAAFPAHETWGQSIAERIDEAVDWATEAFAGLFDVITWSVRGILQFLEAIMVSTPWPVMALLIGLLAWRLAGRRVLIFTALALAYLGLFGFWEKAMSTIALVGASAFICIVVGLPLGILCAKRPTVYTVLKPVMDVMQTMPSFVYLIPAIAFFSVGKPPAVLATVIFALPPMIRLTALGIMQVPEEVREAMLAFGASPRQLLFKAELPLAIPSIMTGVNQSIMMSLSMVVVAALIGAGGLGYDVLFSLQHVETGKGMLAGIAIVLCAMMLDRIVQGKASKNL
ncbi:MAG TPA: proline/glycine betaine ABC transporter permease [Candidatus Competibacteraceae bacterium]|nr:proline/glycine betaine ABC transporter permease [Candidatus Competibacteraceae bacterium]